MIYFSINIRFFFSRTGLNEVPTLAGLHSGPFVKNGLQSLCADAKKIIIGRYHKYYEGLSRKGYRQHIDNVMDLIDPYC